MPLARPFRIRIATIEAFFDLSPFAILEIRRPPDLEILLRKLLARMADAPENARAWV